MSNYESAVVTALEDWLEDQSVLRLAEYYRSSAEGQEQMESDFWDREVDNLLAA